MISSKCTPEDVESDTYEIENKCFLTHSLSLSLSLLLTFITEKLQFQLKKMLCRKRLKCYKSQIDFYSLAAFDLARGRIKGNERVLIETEVFRLKRVTSFARPVVGDVKNFVMRSVNLVGAQCDVESKFGELKR
jgi:hypothetical protein